MKRLSGSSEARLCERRPSSSWLRGAAPRTDSKPRSVTEGRRRCSAALWRGSVNDAREAARSAPSTSCVRVLYVDAGRTEARLEARESLRGVLVMAKSLICERS